MTKFTTFLIGSALTALLASTALAAETPAVTPDTKSAAAPAATPAPAAVSPAEPAAAKEQQLKVGVIDMSKVASESNSGKAAQASLKAKSAKLKAKIEAKQKQIEKQKNEIEAKISTMPPKERDAKAKEFQKKLEEYQKLVRSSEDELQDMQEKLTREMYRDIKKAAEAYAKKNGYSVIVEQKAVLYATDSMEPTDLTEELTGQLNKKKQSK